MALVRTIVAAEAEEASRLLAASPELACARAPVGASRKASTDWFFPEVGHYMYAGDSALHMAAAGYRWPIARELLEKGADHAAKNRRGAEPLHYAADANTWRPVAQVETIDGLISAGADPNARDKSGVSPLHRAVRTRCAPAVRALLAGGAAPRGKNQGGSTPLHLAVQNTGRGGSAAPEAIEQQRQIILLLLESGAKPEDQDGRGRTVKQAARAHWIHALLETR